ncbi:MAG: SGNH/GDSL hydrolase family protein [Acidobacteriota bacterium]
MSRPPLPPIVVALNIILPFLAAALYPYLRGDGLNLLAVLLIGLNLAARRGARPFFERLSSWVAGQRAVQNGLMVLASLIVCLGTLETAGQVLTRTGIVEPYNAILTMVKPGAEDFRTAHITADKYRVPDPVLLWRPIDRHPYTAQRFKGAVLDVPKPAGTFRIMTYGDSNTDGPNRRGWTEVLQEVLARDHADSDLAFEVANAGVAGYSSHQGLLRFRRQVSEYQPDLITVSFGYNDIAPAIGTADREFRLPPAWQVTLQRQLVRYSFYRAADKIARRWAPESPPSVGPRVSLEDYLANLEGFAATGREHGIHVVLLTRPHTPGRDELAKVTHNWRGQIPTYNRSLIELGEQRGIPVIDVQDYFEQNYPDAFYDDCHFTLEGHAHMAEMLARELSAAGVIPAAAL